MSIEQSCRRVHVTCGKDKKVINLSATATVVEQVSQCFKLSGSFILQVWDEEFKDFVNVESDMDVSNKAKLNVVIADVSTAMPIPGLVSPMSVLPSPDVVETCATPLSTTTSAISAASQSTPLSTRQWPVCALVPVHLFSPELKTVLESGCSLLNLKAKFRRQIQEAFFYDMSQYGFYPPIYKYKESALALVTMFPNLRDPQVHTDGHEWWAHAISEKFRNERRSISDVPEVALRKKKRKLDISTEKVINVYGLPMFLPPAPEGEDGETIKSHITWMQAEATKSNMNKFKVRQLMDATFSDRRERIINQQSTLDEMKEVYPLLFSADELRAEYCRLATRESDSLEICARFGDLAAVVFGKGNMKQRKKSDLLVEIMKQASSIESETESSVFLAVKAVSAMAFMLKEEVQYVLVEHTKVPEDCGTPVVTVEGDVREPSACTFRVDIGGMTVCEPIDFFDAIDCLLCTYYTFNFEYAKKASSTLIFLQTYVKGHQDCLSMPRNLSALKLRLKLV